MCIIRAVEVARETRSDAPPLLFINAEPSVASVPLSHEFVAAVSPPRPFQIVAEYTERGLTTHPARLVRRSAEIHQHGNAIAMDDVGAELTSLAFLPLVEPR